MTSRETPSPRPILVLWVIKGLGPGGAEQLLLSSAEVADHSAFDYDVAYVRPDKDQLVQPLRDLDVDVYRLGDSGRWLTDLRGRLGHYDIVHVHSPLLAGAVRLLVRTLPRGRRPAVVSTEHNVWSNFSRPTRLLNAVTGGMDDKRWAVSGEVKRSMWPRLAQRTEVLRHGINLGTTLPPASSRTETRRQLGISSDAPVVICVANLRKEKDYPNLMQAAQQVLEHEPDAVFLAVGQGPMEAELSELHNSISLGDRFRFLAIMEALQLSLPIMATDVGGLSEAVTPDINTASSSLQPTMPRWRRLPTNGSSASAPTDDLLDEVRTSPSVVG